MRLLRPAVLFVALAAATHVAIVAALPWLINAYVMHRVATLAGGTNRPLAAPRPDAAARGVVRPSPDLLYTACVFDLARGPVRVTAPVQDSYVSVSGFAADTRNFFALNDTQVVPGPDGQKRFDVVIARQPPENLPPGAILVIAPSTRGLVLFRSLITRDADAPRLARDFQSRQACAPL